MAFRAGSTLEGVDDVTIPDRRSAYVVHCQMWHDEYDKLIYLIIRIRIWKNAK